MIEEVITTKVQRKVSGSIIAAICGASEYSTPYSVYMQLTDPNSPIIDNQFTRHGKAYEDDTAEFYHQESGNDVRANVGLDFNGQKVYAHPQYDFCTATPDYFTDIDGVKNVPLEIKNTWSSKITEPTVSWVLQTQWQMFVLGAEKGALAWAKNGLYQGHIVLDKDEELWQMMLEKAQDFWENYILKGVAPEPTSPSDMLRAYPREQAGKTLEVVEEVYQLIGRLHELKAQITEMENGKAHLEEQLREIFRDNEAITYGGQVLAVYKQNKPSFKFNVKAFQEANPQLYAEYLQEHEGARVLRLKKLE
jgi:predicted phage-related endonuclease